MVQLKGLSDFSGLNIPKQDTFNKGRTLSVSERTRSSFFLTCDGEETEIGRVKVPQN